jgi:hypothetical protein
MLGVDSKWLCPLSNDVPTEVPNTGGVKVTLIEGDTIRSSLSPSRRNKSCFTANHCPGSSLFLFEGLQTVNAGDSAFTSPFVGTKRLFRYLHCGDFRACPQHALHPAIKGKRIDQVYLDTTYLNPKVCDLMVRSSDQVIKDVCSTAFPHSQWSLMRAPSWPRRLWMANLSSISQTKAPSFLRSSHAT